MLRKFAGSRVVAVAAASLLTGSVAPAYAQQFNSDNYWTAPHGTETTILTVGQSYSTILVVVALFPGWEFNAGVTLFSKDERTNTGHHYSTTLYAKYMFYENQAKNGGFAIMAGTGTQPGYLASGTVTNDFRTYWANAPVTFPFFDGVLSWDLLPGATVNTEYAATQETAWGFTYSTRLAVYKVIPQSAIVAEVFGTEGDARAKPQYRAGIRWESPTVVAALSYSAGLDQSRGAGVELGLMLFSPRFLCFGGCESSGD